MVLRTTLGPLSLCLADKRGVIQSRWCILKEMTLPGPFLFQTRIRYIDTDTSGRIHYTAMFRYFESAEIEFMRSLGIVYLGHEFTFPRVHAECDFKLALQYDDAIEIEVCLTKLGRSSVRFEFRTTKTGEMAAKGVIVVACTNKKTQRAIPIPEEVREKLKVAVTGQSK
ncbi:MAG: acyl-CoA thioesterase [Acidobacteriaceae bacterium]|nr:acyl-CoA thioesterase [Acidobacteriaceae bacterium]